MLKNLFDRFGGKKAKFFLELKETDGDKPAATTETPAPVAAPLSESEPLVAVAAESLKPAPLDVADAPLNLANAPLNLAEVEVPEVLAKPVETDKKAQKTSVKKEKKAKGLKKEAEPETPSPSTSVPTASTNGKVEPTEVEFSTKYLLTPTLSRRRPGPSLNAFKDMARKAKLPTTRR